MVSFIFFAVPWIKRYAQSKLLKNAKKAKQDTKKNFKETVKQEHFKQTNISTTPFLLFFSFFTGNTMHFYDITSFQFLILISYS